MSSPIDLVLSRLEPFKLRATGPDRWRALCPAHDGKNGTSLSVGVGENGAVLLRCWNGCELEAVVSALGLEMHDLFPPPDAHARPMRHPFLPADVFHAVRHEISVVAVIAADMRQHKTINELDWQRLALAARRLDEIGKASYGGR